MRVITGWTGLSEADRGAAVALGNFDGVHVGHLAVLRVAKACAPDAPLAAAVFAPHPRRYFAPDAPPFRLSSDTLRADWLSAAGVERLYVLPFDDDLRAMSPEAFAANVLSQGLGAACAAAGADFRFGQDRAGDMDALAAFGEAMGFKAAAAEPVEAAGGIASSTRVREALRAGDTATAQAILGRPWAIDGIVSKGDQRGRVLGFPTANLPLGDILRPRAGVYAVTAQLESGETRKGVANIGKRPTVGGTEERLEAHLFEFDRDIYGQRLIVEINAFIRDEQTFDTLEALKDQIARDVDAALNA